MLKILKKKIIVILAAKDLAKCFMTNPGNYSCPGAVDVLIDDKTFSTSPLENGTN